MIRYGGGHNEVISGLYGFKDPKSCWQKTFLPLTSVSCDVRVRGFVAHIDSTLTYTNTEQEDLQVRFSCPVDERTAVYHVEAVLNGVKITGKCLEKKKAEKVYSDAVEAGKTALLVQEEQASPDILNMALGNLRSKTEATVHLSMVTELTVSTDGGVQFTLPTVLNPRYCPASKEEPTFRTANQVVASNSREYDMKMNVAVSGNDPIARVISHSDPIDVKLEDGEASAKVTLSEGFKADHDFSLVVYYNNPYKAQVLVEAGDPVATGIMRDQVLMLNLFPKLAADSFSHRNEVIFVVDRSGSMQGDKMKSAQSVLLLFLKSLPPGCLFNIVSFGSNFATLFESGSVEYCEETLQQALKLQSSMDANMGGTEIFRPLEYIYSKPINKNYSRQILLLTDGEVWNVDQVTGLAARNAGNTRVFTVGIGDGASTALVKGLARAGGGRAEMVTQRDRIQTKVMGLVTNMLQASVQNVEVSCEFDVPSRFGLVPSKPPVIFAGQHYIAYARMPPGTQLKKLSVSGEVDGSEWSQTVAEKDVKNLHDENKTFHRLAARAKILDSLDDDSDESKQDTVDLSVKSGVLSRYTSIVAVDEDGTTLLQKKPEESVEMAFTQGKMERVQRSRACFDSFASQPARSMMRSSPQASLGFLKKKSKQRGGMMLCSAPPQQQAFEAKSYSNSAPPPPPPVLFSAMSYDECDSVSEDMCDSVPEDMCDSSSSILDEKENTSELTERIFTDLISSQSFSGSWEFMDIAKSLKVPESLFDSMKSSDTTVAATALVVVLLETLFSHRAVEWQLVARKAKSFMSSKVKEEKILQRTSESKEFLKTLLSSNKHLQNILDGNN